MERAGEEVKPRQERKDTVPPLLLYVGVPSAPQLVGIGEDIHS